MYTVCENMIELNHGFKLCIINSIINKACIKDLNLTIISDKQLLSHLNYNTVSLEYDTLILGKDKNYTVEDGHGTDDEIPDLEYCGFTYISDKNFKEYDYHLHKSLFNNQLINYHYYKIPNNITVMLNHTNLLTNNVKMNCLLMYSVLVYDISTVILPLTLELIRLDYNLYQYIK